MGTFVDPSQLHSDCQVWHPRKVQQYVSNDFDKLHDDSRYTIQKTKSLFIQIQIFSTSTLISYKQHQSTHLPSPKQPDIKPRYPTKNASQTRRRTPRRPRPQTGRRGHLHNVPPAPIHKAKLGRPILSALPLRVARPARHLLQPDLASFSRCKAALSA